MKTESDLELQYYVITDTVKKHVSPLELTWFSTFIGQKVWFYCHHSKLISLFGTLGFASSSLCPCAHTVTWPLHSCSPSMLHTLTQKRKSLLGLSLRRPHGEGSGRLSLGDSLKAGGNPLPRIGLTPAILWCGLHQSCRLWQGITWPRGWNRHDVGRHFNCSGDGYL